MMKTEALPFLWRGMLGAFIGGVLGIAILYLFYFKRAGTAFYWGSFAIIRVLPITIIVGTVVGALIWMGIKQLRIGRLTGAVIGAVIAAIIGSIVGAIIDAQIVTEIRQPIWDGFFIKYGMIAGAVTGLVSGVQGHTNI
ncbi:MAG: hypothetical protein V7641_1668 [Blastocatellia bacterium]